MCVCVCACVQVGGSKEIQYQTNDKNAKNDLTRLEAEVKQIKNLMASRDNQIKQRSNLLVRRLPVPHLPPLSALARTMKASQMVIFFVSLNTLLDESAAESHVANDECAPMR
jgi:hypothetical protein